MGAFVVTDITRPDTLVAAARWKEELDDKVQAAAGGPIPCFLLANKVEQWLKLSMNVTYT
jgi:hypothetical protein